MDKKDKPTNSGMDIPDHVMESIARCLLPKIQRYYESEEGRRAFAQWKAQKELEKKNP